MTACKFNKDKICDKIARNSKVCKKCGAELMNINNKVDKNSILLFVYNFLIST